jgi:hypothetical protein
MAEHVELIREAARLMRQRAEAATAGPWWYDDDADCWRLHGVAARLPSGIEGWPDQLVNSQILKAPKHGTPYAEYWPSDADAEHIASWHPGVALAVAALLDSLADLYSAGFVEPQPLPMAIVRAYLGKESL